MIDANGWDDDISAAPKGAKDLVFAVPYTTEDGRTECFHCPAEWAQKLSGGFWKGDWLYVGKEEPTHWKRLGIPVAYQKAEEAA